MKWRRIAFQATVAFVAVAPIFLQVPVFSQDKPAEPAAPSTPAGPSALSETYNDWEVACSAAGEGRRCSLAQRQAREDGQRVLAIELMPQAGELKGMLVLPFGLGLAKGVSFAIDDSDAGKALPFSTCLPAGCLVPLAFAADTIEALRQGTTLKLGVFTSDTGEPVQLSISLKGFAAALERTAALTQ